MFPSQTQKMVVGKGLIEQLRVLLVVLVLCITFTVVMLTSVTRDELNASDTIACNGARDNKCSRSKPWRWGSGSGSFGVIYSYQMLSSCIMALIMFLFGLFFALGIHFSLGANQDHEGVSSQPGPIFLHIHNAATFLVYGFLITGLIYFGFGLEALVHIKFPSYKPSFWDNVTGEAIEEAHNPPYERFLAIISWFNMSVAVVAFLFFATISKVPLVVSMASQQQNNPPETIDA